MELKKWSARFLPIATFFLGLLIGSLPGGLSRAGNLGPIALYLVLVGAVWAAVAVFLRRQGGRSHQVSRRQ